MSRSNDPSTPKTALLTPQYASSSLTLPLYRRRSFRRGIFAIILILIGLVISYVYRDLPRSLRLAQLQRRCLAYTAPSDQVVYSELASDMANLPPSSQEYALDLSASPSMLLHRPLCWVDYHAASIRVIGGNYPVLFLGERSNGAQRRLVSVQFWGWVDNSRSRQTFGYRPYAMLEPSFRMSSFEIGGLNSMPDYSAWSSGGGFGVATSSLQSIKNLRIFAGQRDPKDSSKFTIIYQANDKPGTIEGRLESDGTVSLQIIDGPLKAPPVTNSLP